MELEFHQLDPRYERLRMRQPAREQRLLASLADAGQQMPIVVVMAGALYVVVDGHKRVRCLRRLHRDTVAAVVWEMSEPEALMFRQLLRTDATDSAFEQGWLLRTLHEDHGVALDVLARRFDRSVSWVSRRLSLVRTLPETIQHHVHDGHLVAHAAMKYLVPLGGGNTGPEGVFLCDRPPTRATASASPTRSRRIDSPHARSAACISVTLPGRRPPATWCSAIRYSCCESPTRYRTRPRGPTRRRRRR
jgi:ParB/RepB/Spo0J family partition protein